MPPTAAPIHFNTEIARTKADMLITNAHNIIHNTDASPEHLEHAAVMLIRAAFWIRLASVG